MKIFSLDEKSSLTIELVADEETGYSSYAVEASVDLGHSAFVARNNDVQVFGIDEFKKDLDLFVLDRSMTPRLQGTYDTEISISGVQNHVFLHFCVGSEVSGVHPQVFSLTGGFELSQEHLLAFIDGLSRYSD